MESLAIPNPGTTNERLWQAVIENAISEWLRGPEQHKHEAERFLFQDEDDFPFVCRYAGLNPESVRESLWLVRALAASESTTNAA
ncbi:MAG: hypothetical protein ACRD4Y_07370 [Candidatus Acidiferrales bacterium]